MHGKNQRGGQHERSLRPAEGDLFPMRAGEVPIRDERIQEPQAPLQKMPD